MKEKCKGSFDGVCLEKVGLLLIDFGHSLYNFFSSKLKNKLSAKRQHWCVFSCVNLPLRTCGEVDQLLQQEHVSSSILSGYWPVTKCLLSILKVPLCHSPLLCLVRYMPTGFTSANGV